MVLIEGVVTDNKIARWADWVVADHVHAVLGYLDAQLDQLDKSITGMAITTPVLNFEMRVREAVRITSPWFETQPGGTPEPVTNVMRLALDVQALADRVTRFRKAGGKSAGDGDTRNCESVENALHNAAFEIRTNVMSEMFADPPTKRQVMLSRILAGAITEIPATSDSK